LRLLRANNDVVDGNVNQLDEKSNESHDEEADRGGQSNLLELFGIRLGASLDEAVGVHGELLGWLKSGLERAGGQLHFLGHGLLAHSILRGREQALESWKSRFEQKFLTKRHRVLYARAAAYLFLDLRVSFQVVVRCNTVCYAARQCCRLEPAFAPT